MGFIKKLSIKDTLVQILVEVTRFFVVYLNGFAEYIAKVFSREEARRSCRLILFTIENELPQ